MHRLRHVFQKKHTLRIVVMTAVVAFIIFVMIIIDKSLIKAHLLNVQAAWIEREHPEEAYKIYETSLAQHPTVTALLSLIQILIDEGRYEEVKPWLDRGKAMFSKDQAFRSFIQRLKPPTPELSLKEGVYHRPETIDIYLPDGLTRKDDRARPSILKSDTLSRNALYQDGRIAVRINDGAVQYFPYTLNDFDAWKAPASLQFTHNGRYVLEIWAENVFSIESDHNTYVFTFDIPQPTLVAKPNSGTYMERQTIQLVLEDAEDDSGDTLENNWTIYYTVDGSDPIKHGRRYTGSLELPFGLTHLKAIAIDARGMESTVVDEQYRIGIPKHGLLFFDGIFASGYAYDYRAYPGKLTLYTKDRHVSVHVATDGMCSYLQEADDALYGICQKKIYRLDLKQLVLRPVSDVSASKLAIVDSILFYVDASSGHLYATEANQFAPRIILDKKIKALDVDPVRGKVYISVEEEGVYVIDALAVLEASTIKPQTILNEAVEAFYVHDPSWKVTGNAQHGVHERTNDAEQRVYFIQKGTLYREYHGKRITVREREHTHDEEKRPWFGTFHVFDTQTSYDKLVAAGDRLFVRETIVVNDTERGSWTGRIVQASSRQRYVWHEIRLDTGQMRPTNVTTSLLFVTDEGIIDENGAFFPYQQ